MLRQSFHVNAIVKVTSCVNEDGNDRKLQQANLVSFTYLLQTLSKHCTFFLVCLGKLLYSCILQLYLLYMKITIQMYLTKEIQKCRPLKISAYMGKKTLQHLGKKDSRICSPQNLEFKAPESGSVFFSVYGGQSVLMTKTQRVKYRRIIFTADNLKNLRNSKCTNQFSRILTLTSHVPYYHLRKLCRMKSAIIATKGFHDFASVLNRISLNLRQSKPITVNSSRELMQL